MINEGWMGGKEQTALSWYSGSVTVLLMIGAAVASIGIVATLLFRRKKQASEKDGIVKFFIPKSAKPVIGFKWAAGPGGLKKSPTPVHSPEGLEGNEWGLRTSGHSGSLELSITDSLSSQEDDVSANHHISSRNKRVNLADVVGSRGQLQFSLRYSFEKSALQITVIGAKDLPTIYSTDHLNNTEEASVLDPYVKLQLLPEKQHKVKTRVVRNTVDPVYDEEFTFYGIGYNQLQSTTLHFVVVSFDRFSRDEIIGEVVCPLHSIDLSDPDQQATLNLELVSRTSKLENVTSRGELLVSMCYQPAAGKITVVVLKAKNLPKFDITGLADPYVKIYLIYNGQRVAKKKTHVKKRTLTPVYNESFVFDLPTMNNPNIDLQQISFELLLIDWDRVTKNEVMGRCVIGPNSDQPSGVEHWTQMVNNGRRQIAEWHKLRP